MSRPHNAAFQKVVDDMRAIPQSADEAGHQDADALLLVALYVLVHSSNIDVHQVDALVAAYESISKWYA